MPDFYDELISNARGSLFLEPLEVPFSDLFAIAFIGIAMVAALFRYKRVALFSAVFALAAFLIRFL